MKYIINSGNARILSAIIEDFVSVNSEGLLEVTIESLVDFTAEYHITVIFDTALV